MSRVIAIDGPSASGKSTVSRETARRLGWVYVDSGAVYRGLTWEFLRRGIDVRDAAAVARALPEVRVEFFLDETRAARCRINQAVLDAELRSAAVCENVSFVAAVPAVRAQVVEWLRSLTRFGNLVMEGRDIGTVVFPDAACKFYLDADPAERARRRQRELEARADPAALQAVDASLRQRDELDRGRATAPLRVAGDARVLETTAMDVAAVVECVVSAAAALTQKSAKCAKC